MSELQTREMLVESITICDGSKRPYLMLRPPGGRGIAAAIYDYGGDPASLCRLSWAGKPIDRDRLLSNFAQTRGVCVMLTVDPSRYGLATAADFRPAARPVPPDLPAPPESPRDAP